ncbi:MAG: hypothetical protein AB7H43_00760 [Acidimicrobiia bacterium]
MKRKKTALALSLTIPLLLEGAASAGAAESYPPGSPPTEPGPQTPPTSTPSPPGPGLVPDRTGPVGTGLPVTGGDVAGLAIAGAGALVVGFGLNSAAGRRRYGVLEPFAVATGPPPGSSDPVAPPAVDDRDQRPSTEDPEPETPPERETEGSTVSMYEHQFRIAPEALERDDLLEGLEGQTRERLAAVLHAAATSYRATLEELEAARGAAQAGGGGGAPAADRFAELGEHVAWVLRASHDAAEEERRKAREEVELTQSEALADLTRRREEVDELERRAAERLRLADEEAAAKVAGAREEAEQHASTIRSEAETQLSSLLQLQESLRVQLVEASQELRRSLDSLGAAEAPAPPAPADEGSAAQGAPPAWTPSTAAWTPEPGPSTPDS